MKKIILTIITLSIISYAGCYDPDTATVRINLGNIPIAHNEPKLSFIDKVLRIFTKDAMASEAETLYIDIVHVAAYSGDSVIATASIDAGDVRTISGAASYDYVELSVPAGENITILVIGESFFYEMGNKYRNVDYFGASDPVSCKAGETANTTVNAKQTSSYSSDSIYNINFDQATGVASWNEPKIKIPARYKLVYNNSTTSATTTYESYENHITINESMTDCSESLELELVFDDFSLEASVSSFSLMCK